MDLPTEIVVLNTPGGIGLKRIVIGVKQDRVDFNIL